MHIQHFSNPRHLPGAMIAVAYCPVCHEPDEVICRQGRLYIQRKRINNEPVEFVLLSSAHLHTYWRIDISAYGQSRLGVKSEQELVDGIRKNPKGYAEVVIIGPCTKKSKPERYGAYFSDEIVWPGSKSIYCLDQLLNLPLLEQQPEADQKVQEPKPSTSGSSEPEMF